MHGHVRRLRCGALIINIVPFSVPNPHIIGIHSVGFIAFYVFDTIKLADVIDGIGTGRILQPVADNDFLDGTVCVSQNIYGFLLGILTAGG